MTDLALYSSIVLPTMIRRLITALTIIFFAGLILTTSIFRTAQVKYDFTASPSPTPDTHTGHVHIQYLLPPTNYINPIHPLWPFKAAKDKLWLALTTNPLKKAQISLYLANNRLVYAKDLFENNKVDESVIVMEKAERYLVNAFELADTAYKQGNVDVSLFVTELAIASLKHREILETIHDHSPEDAMPIISKIIDHPKSVFEKTTHYFNSVGEIPPNNPFNR